MSSTDFLKSILSGFAASLVPLRDAVASPDAFAAFLKEFGWSLSAADQADVTGALGGLSSLPDDTSSQSLEQLAGEIGAAADTIRKLASSGAPAAFASTFPHELLDYLVYGAIAQGSAGLFGILHFAGVLDERHVPADAATGRLEYTERRVHWDRLASLADDPAGTFRESYGWGGDFDGDALLRSVGILVRAFGGNAGMHGADRHLVDEYYARGTPYAAGARNLVLSAPFLDASATSGTAAADVKLAFLGLPIPPSPAAAAPPDGLALMPVLTGQATDTIALSDQVSLKLTGDFLARPVRAELHPGSAVVRATPGDAHLDAGARLDARAPAATPWLAFGDATSSRLEVSAVHAALGMSGEVDGDLDFHVEAGLDTASLVVDLGEGDGFVQSALPSQTTRSPLSLTVKWSSKSGFALGGQPKLAVTLPVQESLGGVATIDSVGLALGPGDGGVALATTVTVAVSIGPFGATIADVGIRFLLVAVDDASPPGNLGNVDLQFGFQPPSGIGLSVDAGILRGGGFVGRDPATGRYGGVLDLRVAEIDITALGLVETKVPEGHAGYALLLALYATFPGIQVGFGIALTGVGGLIALNRRVDVDALRARLASGTAGRILAPQDPVRNAPALLADLDAVFPVAPGITVVGPTVQLVWADLVHLDVGVFIELPGPARVILLGSAHAEIARDGQAYLRIRVDILGVIDFRGETAAFDAALVDSHLIGILDLTGGAAFRLSWGAQPYVVLTLGGFNPSYDPAPLAFPASLTRIAMVHGKPTDEVYLRFEGYFAITSNTLQFGASVEAAINSGGWTIHGSIAFDALIQRVPYHFEFDIRASVSVSYHGHNLASLTLTGSLTGPGPTLLKAKVCIELLFFDVCFSHTFTLGASTPPPLPVAPDLLDALLAELTDPARLRAAGGPDPLVRVRPPDPTLTTPVVAPTGTLVWDQQRAPLDLLLTRVGGTPLPAPVQINATSTATSTGTTDWFAPGQFLDLTDDEALTRPGYELLASGVRLAGGASVDGPSGQTTLTTRQIRLPAAATTTRPPHAFPTWLLTAAAPAAAPAFTLTAEKWVVRTPAGERADLTGAQARQLASLTEAGRAVPESDRLAAFAF